MTFREDNGRRVRGYRALGSYYLILPGESRRPFTVVVIGMFLLHVFTNITHDVLEVLSRPKSSIRNHTVGGKGRVPIGPQAIAFCTASNRTVVPKEACCVDSILRMVDDPSDG